MSAPALPARVLEVADRLLLESLAGDLTQGHWSVPDPVPSGSRAAFDAAHDMLAERIAFMAPPVTPGEAALR